MRMATALASAFTCLIVAACGGGGGGSASSSSGGTGSSSSGGSTGHTLTLSRSRVDLYSENFFSSGSTEFVDVTFSGAGLVVGTLPGETQPSWLTVFDPQVTSPTQARVTLSFFQQALDNVPQRNSVTLRFATGNADGSGVVFRDLVVTGTLDHTVSPPLHVLTHVRDAAASPSTTLDVLTRNATWEASSDVPWLQVSPTSGSGNAILQVTTSPGALPEGDHVGLISVRDTVTQRTKTATVRMGVNPRRLEVDRRGVALSSTLGRSRLQADIRVSDTSGQPGRWKLTDDADWLTANVTQGAGASVVTLEATAANLPNGTHYANVTIAPDAEPALSNSATVRVGFFVDEDAVIQNPTRLAGEAPFVVVADPVRPLVYGLRNTPPDITLRAWNVHTGALVHTVVVPNASFVSRARVSPDGSKLVLYASGEPRLIPVALSAGTPVVGTPWTGMRAGSDDFTFTQINGSEVIVWSPGQLLSASTGGVLATLEGLSQSVATFPSSIAVSPGGERLFMVGTTVANHFLVYAALGYRGGQHSAVVLREFLEPHDGRMAYFDPDGIHVVSRSSQELNRYTFGQIVPDRTLPTGGGWDLFPSAYGGFYVTESSGANWLHYASGLDVIASLSPGSAGEPLLWALSGDETRFFYRDSSQMGFFGALRDLGF
jgi:hypothetical protein